MVPTHAQDAPIVAVHMTRPVVRHCAKVLAHFLAGRESASSTETFACGSVLQVSRGASRMRHRRPWGEPNATQGLQSKPHAR